jgi:hypothetical protein
MLPLVSDAELRQELEASLRARQEVGAELEPQLVESFVDKIEAEIDRRVDARLASQRPTHSGGVPLAVPLGSLGIGIPLVGAAGGTAGTTGVFLACLAIVLVNAFYYASSRLN